MLYTANLIESEFGIKRQTLFHHRDKGLIKGYAVGGTVIFTEKEVQDYLAGNEPESPERLYSVQTAAEKMGLSPYTIYELIRQGSLEPTSQFHGRGLRKTIVLSESKLESIPQLLEQRPGPGRKAKDDVDRLIEERDGRFIIIGSRKDKDGNPFSYTVRHRARTKARQINHLYDEGAEVYLKAGFVTTAILLHPVTSIDTTALVQKKNGRNQVVRTADIKGLTEQYRLSQE